MAALSCQRGSSKVDCLARGHAPPPSKGRGLVEHDNCKRCGPMCLKMRWGEQPAVKIRRSDFYLAPEMLRQEERPGLRRLIREGLC